MVCKSDASQCIAVLLPSQSCCIPRGIPAAQKRPGFSAARPHGAWQDGLAGLRGARQMEGLAECPELCGGAGLRGWARRGALRVAPERGRRLRHTVHYRLVTMLQTNNAAGYQRKIRHLIQKAVGTDSPAKMGE